MQKKCSKLDRLWIIGILSLLFSQNINAQEPTTNLADAINQYITDALPLLKQGHYRIKTGIDDRLKRLNCQIPLEISSVMPLKANTRHTMKLMCSQPIWQRYVPVSISIERATLVAAQDLPRGHLITANDLIVKTIATHTSRSSTYSTPSQLIGAKIKRPIRADRAITSRYVCLVCRNDSVKIEVKKAGFSLITQGIALNDGVKGDTIRVQNTQSKRIIPVIIHDVGKVLVRF